MLPEEVIPALKEAIRIIECIQEDSPINQELTFWRRRFMDIHITEIDQAKNNYMRNVFLTLPCQSMMKDDPSKHLKNISEIYDYNKNTGL